MRHVSVKRRCALVTAAYRSLVQHFDRVRFCYVVLSKGLFQLLQRGPLPLPEHNQVNVTADTKAKSNACQKKDNEYDKRLKTT